MKKIKLYFNLIDIDLLTFPIFFVIYSHIALSAGAVEYTNSISAES